MVAPGGYVGVTTCYELGRAHGRRIPTYFSDVPRDLPIEVPPGSVLSVRDLVCRPVGDDRLDALRSRQRSWPERGHQYAG